MTRIPFIRARLPAPDEFDTLEKRLQAHLRALRARRAAPKITEEEDELGTSSLSYADTRKIQRRVRRLQDLRMTKSGLGNLKSDDLKRLEPLRDGVRVAVIPDEHRADEIAAELHADMPWMANTSNAVWNALRRSALTGTPARIPPLILVGEPGIGKTHFAKKLAKAIGVPMTTVDATNEGAGFGVVGTQRGWGTQGSGRLIDLILQTLTGNPIIFIDELEKVGNVQSNRGMAYRLDAALLPLLEPETNGNWICPYFRVGFDMSHVSWIMAANSLAGIIEPVLSRCQIIDVPRPTLPQLLAFMDRQGRARGLGEASIDAIRETLEVSSARGMVINLRIVIAMLNRAEVMERRPMLN